MTNTADDDEWEYEYDENETEDFYVPVDLSNVPEAQGPVTATARPGHPTLLKSRLRALQAVRTQAEIATDTSDTQDPTASMGELQIIGLHTSNPLITYNGQLLSCHWASTIGTDMFFVKPNPDDDTLGQPLRSLPAVDLLAIGSAKLIARVGGLRPRDDLFDTTDGGDQMVAETGAQPASTEASQPSANDEEAATSASQPAPQSFLARLNEIKAKRGETSRLAVSQTTNGARLISKEADMSSSAQPEEDVQMGGI